MNGCCEAEARAGESDRRPARRAWNAREVAGGIVSSVTLALLPKCPACLAAYIALASGIGISMPAAAHLRTGMVVLCAGALVFILARRVRGFMARRKEGKAGMELSRIAA